MKTRPGVDEKPIADFTGLKGHQAQWVNGALIVAGGDDGLSSEKCTLNKKDEFTCINITALLTDSYPFLFHQIIANKFVSLSVQCLIQQIIC